jgi:hypothetical protein
MVVVPTPLSSLGGASHAFGRIFIDTDLRSNVKNKIKHDIAGCLTVQYTIMMYIDYIYVKSDESIIIITIVTLLLQCTLPRYTYDT